MPTGSGNKESKKRKREEEHDSTIVTFHAPKKTFARIFRESSLEETKDLVRDKLRLSSDVSLRLILLRADILVDLEDDDDYEAFAVLARSGHTDILAVVDGEMPTNIPAIAGVLSRDRQEPVSTSSSHLGKRRRMIQHDDGARLSVGPNEPLPPQVRRMLSPVIPTERAGLLIAGERAREDVSGDPLPDQPLHTRTEDLVAGPSRRTISRNSFLPSQDGDHRSHTREDALAKRSGKKKTDSSRMTRERPDILELDSVPPVDPVLPVKQSKSKQTLAKPTSVPSSAPVVSTSTSGLEPTRSKKDKEKQTADPHYQGLSAEPQVDGGGTTTLSHKANVDAIMPEAEPRASEEPQKKKKKKPKSATMEILAAERTVSDLEASLQGRESRAKRIRFEPPGEEHVAEEVQADAVEKPKKKKKKKVSKESTPVVKEPAASQPPPTIVPSLPSSEVSQKNRTPKQPGSRAKSVKDDKNATVVPSNETIQPVSSQDVRPQTATTKKDWFNSEMLYERLVKPHLEAQPTDATAVASTSRTVSSSSSSALDAPQERFSPATTAHAEQLPTKPVLATTTDGTAAIPHSVATVEATSKAAAARKKSGRSRLTQKRGPEDFEGELESAPPPVTRTSVDALPPPSLPLPPSATAPVNTKSKKKQKDAACLICRSTPFHLRFQCPVILGGAKSIESRLTEMKNSGVDEELVKEMHEHLEKARQKERTEAERSTRPGKSAQHAPTDRASPSPARSYEEERGVFMEISFPSSLDRLNNVNRTASPEIPFPLSPAIPAGSEIDEVLVQGKDEGSSADTESSDDGRHGPKPQFPKLSQSSTTASRSLPLSQVDTSEASLEALLRGPAKRKSVLQLIEVETSSSSESDSESPQLASEAEERDERAYRRLSKRFERDAPSSDEEFGFDQDAEDTASLEHLDNSVPGDIRTTSTTPENVPMTSSAEVSDELQVADDSMKAADDVGEQAGLASGNINLTLAGDTDSSSHDASRSRPETPHIEATPDTSAHIDDHIQTPPPDPPSRQSEDPADPIEHTDDLRSPATRREEAVPDSDPIEDADDDADANVQSSLLSASKSPISRRMKDRRGRVPSPKDLPVRAADDSLLSHKRIPQDQAENVVLAEQNAPEPASAASVTARTGGQLTQNASSAISTVDNAPKRRGRPPLSDAEKAKRAAEKQAEKDRKAVEKQTEKDRKAATKKANQEEKARVRAEKASGKGVKAQITREASLERPVSAAEATQVEDMLVVTASTSAVTALPKRSFLTSAVDTATAIPINGYHEKQSNPSVAKWTALSPNELPDGDSMIDELRSSSEPSSESGPLHDETAAAVAGGSSSEQPLINSAPRKNAPNSGRSLDPDATPTQKIAREAGLSPQKRVSPKSTLQPLPQTSAGPHSRSPAVSGTDISESELIDIYKAPLRPVSHWGADMRYRRLSDIASQQLFTPIASSSQSTLQAANERERNFLRMLVGDDEYSDSSSESEVDGNRSLLIPPERRAGVRPRKSNTQ